LTETTNINNSTAQHQYITFNNTIDYRASIATMDDTKSRSLDFVERYHVAQHRAGSLPCITIIGSMIHPDFDQMMFNIQTNVERLMREHPVLVAGIDDTDSRRPRWIINNNEPPLVTDQYLLHPVIDANRHPVSGAAEVASIEDAEAQEFNLAQGPLWRVAIYKPKLDYPAAHYVALTIHHAVTDSMGALNLFEDVLRPHSVNHNPGPERSLPPKAKKTMRIQPSIAGIIKKGVRSILNHKSSWKVTGGHGVTIKWPPPSLLKAPPRKSDVSHISLDLRKDQYRVVERLEALGDHTGSVHSLLHTAAVIALTAATANDIFHNIDTETPKSLRSEDLTHPRIGGNYTGLIERSIPRWKLGRYTVASFTKKFNDYIHSPEGESEARSNMGELLLAPDRIIPDFWKASLTKTATSGDPYRHSLSISNLGRFDSKDIIGLEKVWFSHASMP
jgi:hypothetical protein